MLFTIAILRKLGGSSGDKISFISVETFIITCGAGVHEMIRVAVTRVFIREPGLFSRDVGTFLCQTERAITSLPWLSDSRCELSIHNSFGSISC